MASRPPGSPQGGRAPRGSRAKARRPDAAETFSHAAETAAPGAAEAPPAAEPPPQPPARSGNGRPSRRTISASAAAMEASRRVVEAGPQIVLKAISVLEEEVVASGLGAAKRIEQRFLNVEELRAQHPDALMSRLRVDAHDAVDLVLDVITAATLLVSERAGKMVNVTASRAARAPAAAPEAPAQSGVPVVRVPAPVAAGGTAELTMSLENESEQATAQFTLHVSELVTSSGARIGADRVSFDPATLVVGPRGVGQVTVRIAVPAGTPPGSYEGIVRASQLEHLRAVLLLRVVA